MDLLCTLKSKIMLKLPKSTDSQQVGMTAAWTAFFEQGQCLMPTNLAILSLCLLIVLLEWHALIEVRGLIESCGNCEQGICAVCPGRTCKHDLLTHVNQNVTHACQKLLSGLHSVEHTQWNTLSGTHSVEPAWWSKTPHQAKINFMEHPNNIVHNHEQHDKFIQQATVMSNKQKFFVLIAHSVERNIPLSAKRVSRMFFGWLGRCAPRSLPCVFRVIQI